ncbi:DUF559 domain-containing protein, partial [Candidatus Aerophobetes bacterium]|nr:DUF559 domain-containing protein [Candidatus Aerophobetes bacterium]
VVVDLCFPEKRIAIFVDGCYWHSCPICFEKETRKGVRGYDARTTKKLQQFGWKVIRIWEHEIKGDLESCIKKVLDLIK